MDSIPLLEEDDPSAGRERARPMAPDDRRDAILDAVIPLLLEHGRDATSRQFAEAAGVAEGTVFRAFGDKESLVRAAAERFLDPLPLRAALKSIDPELLLEDKLKQVLELLQSRFQGVFRMMAVLGDRGRPPSPVIRAEFADIVADLMAPHLADLNWPAEQVGPLIRLIAFSSAMPAAPQFLPVTLDDLTEFALYGLVGKPQKKD